MVRAAKSRLGCASQFAMALAVWLAPGLARSLGQQGSHSHQIAAVWCPEPRCDGAS